VDLLFHSQSKISIEGLIAYFCVINEPPGFLGTVRNLTYGISLCLRFFVVFQLTRQILTTVLVRVINRLFSIIILIQGIFKILFSLKTTVKSLGSIKVKFSIFLLSIDINITMTGIKFILQLPLLIN